MGVRIKAVALVLDDLLEVEGIGRTSIEALCAACDRLWCAIAGALT